MPNDIPLPADTRPDQTSARLTDAPARAPAWRRVVAVVPPVVWRTLLALAGAAYFGFAILILVLRYGVLPNIDSYRGNLERMLTDSLGLKVTIAAIDADWQGLNPRLALHGLQVLDAAGRPALSFENVQTVVSWTSISVLALRLDRMEINGPTLAMRREADGALYVAGIRMNTEAEQGDLSDWILKQGRIVIRDATLQWHDVQRGAPPLELKHVNLRLDNGGSRHRFGLTAQPPAAMAAQIDVRGDFRGRNFDRLEEWAGEAYAELAYADLAVWRQWIDYPLELPQGSGALRLWVEVAQKSLTSVTADVAADNVQLRLKPELPLLDLAALNGRITARLPRDGFEVGGRRLALATRDGVRVAPTDFSLIWRAADTKAKGRGELTADGLDLDALAKLAAHLPLDAGTRQRLAELVPRGKLFDVALGWSGAADAPETYTVRARFEQFGINPRAAMPGCAGISGSLEGDEKGGRITLASRGAALMLPQAFHEPRMDLEQLHAQASWSVAAGAVEVQLKSLAFENRDASGSAFGHYRTTGQDAGEIDLTARLTRGDADAVWRYLPRVVGPEVRDWLKHSIVGGRSDDTRLLLKGKLKDFPFADSKLGLFRVSGRFGGAALRFAPGWPELTKIGGELLFEGKRMLITSNQGAVYGVSVNGATAEIADLGSNDPMLAIKGRAAGPTADFLRYIAASPLADWIDHFTDGMRANGNGTLQLGLQIPLARKEKSKGQGEYVFANNQIEVEPGAPPLSAASGRVQFSESTLAMRDVTATLLGSPMSLSAETRNGGVAISAQGSASIAGLRQHFDLALFDHLSGSTSWRGSINIRQHKAEVQFDSNLQGVSSSLPEPLNKTAAEILPLHFERSALQETAVMAREAAPRDLIRVTLGSIVNATLSRRTANGRSAIERGMIGINETPQLAPQQGVLVTGTFKSLNLDAWRRLFRGGAEGSVPPLPVTTVNLKAAELSAFGQQLTDFGLHAALSDDVWRGEVESRELAGNLTWRSQGKGRLQARLKQLSVVEVKPQPATDVGPVADEEIKELPGLDVVADSFSLRGKKLGRLELQAVNRGNLWHIEKLSIRNPDGSLDADGQWRAGVGSGATRLNFTIDAADVGQLLGRLGYGMGVKRGTAKLQGKVAWAGAPSAIDYPSLDGSLSLEAHRGQFAKLEPGVGRLLGVLSLQALPRRISLDFRDVFSEGFAFDSITGSVSARRGVMETQNLAIQGPSAKVLMTGDVSLVSETQNLKVRVQPTLSETVAIGAAVVNPLAGVAAYVAQKVLKDPIEQMFAYEYGVTGTWADPKVEKLAVRTPAQANPNQ